MAASTAALRKSREMLVRLHTESESRHEFDVTLATMEHPRYEVIPTGEVHDGAQAVAAFYRELVRAFPDFTIELRRLYHAQDAVIAEVDFSGTHRGFWRGLPPTGRVVRYPITAIHLFEGDRMLLERLYFDLNTILRQVGLAGDPTTLRGRVGTALRHPLTVARSLVYWLRNR